MATLKLKVDEKEDSITTFRKLMYSSNEIEFEEIEQSFLLRAPESVKDYYVKNWKQNSKNVGNFSPNCNILLW